MEFFTLNLFSSSAVKGPIDTILVFCKLFSKVFSSKFFSSMSKNARTDDALVKTIPSILFCENNSENSFHLLISPNECTS